MHFLSRLTAFVCQGVLGLAQSPDHAHHLITLVLEVDIARGKFLHSVFILLSTDLCNHVFNFMFIRSYSPAPRRQSDYSVSPRRPAEHPRSPRGPPVERDGDQKRRSYSPAYGNDEQNQSNGYAE